MITAEGVRFEYPGVRALDDVSLSVEAGSITALVGPNGAGKTTLLRCLAALEEPLTGHIVIDGIDVIEQPRECHRRIGYLSDFFGLYEELTVRQSLSYVAAAHHVASAGVDGAVTLTAERVGIADRLESRARELSRGLRQRVAIAQAIIHSPKVVILDEPASGLDPEARHSLARLFVELRDRGMTLIVSSHILAELAEYSTDMLVLRGGRVVEHAPIAADESGARMTLSLAQEHPGAAALVAGMAHVRSVRAGGRAIEFSFNGDERARHGLLKALIEAGVPVCGLALERRSLQESYLATTGGDPEPPE